LALASTVPSCEAYDPAFAYETAEIVRRGIDRMYGDEPEDVFYYLTLYNENYPMPPMPEGVEQGIIDGLYRWQAAPDDLDGPKASLLFSGTAQGAVRQAAAELAEKWGVAVDLWSATSYKRLREEAMAVERWNRLHPADEPRVPLVTELLSTGEGPVVAVTDFMRSVPDQVSRWVPDHRSWTSLGTDGYGRSDTREALRRYFETDAPHVVVAVLAALASNGQIDAGVVEKAIADHDVDPERAVPWHG
jgi:pyruvate dehydrogenase E1 component